MERGLPVMKQLSVFGAAIWNGALTLLGVMFWGFIIALGIYGVIQWLGFSDKAAYWSAIISVGTMVILFCLRRISKDTLTMWGLTLLGSLLFAAGVLVIGFPILSIILWPPQLSMHELMVIGLILLAGILWQLTKLTSKR
jgi:hypothetical protein